MEQIDDTFLHLRAEQLAVMMLTRRTDLRVLSMTGTNSVDLVVSVLKAGGDAGRWFGVKVFGRSADAMTSPAQHSLEVSDAAFPVCLFEFVMETDEARWRWVKEPSGDSLTSASKASLLPLTDQAVAEIIDRVVAWYDRRRASVAA